VTTTPPPLPNRQPILETVAASYAALWEGRDDALRLAAFPAGLILALNLFISWQLLPSASDPAATFDPTQPTGISPWFYPVSFLGLIPATLFACNWQRALLLGGEAAPGLGIRWGLRETKFLVWTILIALAMLLAALVVAIPVIAVFAVMGVVLGIVQGAPTSPGAMPSVPLIIAAGLPVAIAEIYVAIRLMLALPATALDGSDEFRLSWRLTRGNALRIFVAAVLGVIPFYVGAFVFEYLLAMAGLYALVPFTGTLLVVLVSMVLSAAGSTVLAMVYLRLGGPVPARV
jgi:hypothetical protein